MRVVVPYTKLRIETARALDASGYAWEPVKMTHDESYWELLADLWAARETFVIVEHDVVIEPGSLRELDECDTWRCSIPIEYMNGPYAGLGCTKFDARTIAARPNALERVAGMSDATHAPKHWCRLDAWLQAVLAGLPLHIHSGVLDHMRDTATISPSHGCI